ncbi:hypothetical protein [Marinobacter sp. MBR-105]
MPYRALSLTLAITAGVAGTVWLLSAENEGSFRGPLQDTNSSAPQMVANQDTVAPATPAGPVPEPPSENALGFMLASVAEEYQQTIRYPDYSVPLTKAQAEAYQGNRYHPVVLPLEGDGRFVVTLDKFRFSQGEPILVVASLNGRQVFGQSLSATPGDRTDYAFGPEEGYEFSPPDLDGLRDQPAMNPESEQRAALLRQLADKF